MNWPKIIGKTTLILLISYTGFMLLINFGVPNRMRYFYEKYFDTVNPELMEFTIRIMDDSLKTYEVQEFEYLEFDFNDTITLKYSKYPKDKEIMFYARIYNSDDPLVVVVNDKVVINSDMENREYPNFWEYWYLKKSTAQSLENLHSNSYNEVIINTGTLNQKIHLQLK